MANSTAWIHSVSQAALEATSIEQESLRQIQQIVPQGNWSEGEWRVVCRMIHTCGDPSLACDIQFLHDPISAGVNALRRGCDLYVDSQMQKAGLSLAKLQMVDASFTKDKVHCHVADHDVAAQAKSEGKARSLFAIRKARPHLTGGIVAIGNAPVALLELNRMILENRSQPALVIGVPVGFVHVEESKQELARVPVQALFSMEEEVEVPSLLRQFTLWLYKLFNHKGVLCSPTSKTKSWYFSLDTVPRLGCYPRYGNGVS